MRVITALLTTMSVALGVALLSHTTVDARSDFVLAAAQVPPAVPPAEPPPTRPSPLAVETDQAGETGWGATAVWIAIGMVALVLLALAVILSVRDGGRTVLKE